MLLSIIVPNFNEEKYVIQSLSNLKKNLLNFSSEYELIVIDDGSSDSSLSKLKQNKNLYSALLENKSNLGKGGAVKKGLSIAKGDYIIFHDSDLEYDSNNIIDFLMMIKNFGPDLILGSRKNYKNYTRSHNIYNYFGNRLISFIFNILNNTTFSDIYTCYVCYKRELLEYDDLKTNGWQQHAEILSRVVKKSKKIYEIPINYNGRSIEEGKKIRPIHMVSVIYTLIKLKFF